MSDFKIIFSGPVGAGKTTAITTISDIAPVSTDELATDMTRSRKNGTTVAMDYGLIKLQDNEQIHLYGTPGQERFDFMWEILTQGGIGLVLLISNQRPDPFRDLHFFLNAFKEFIAQGKVVVGVT
ncbi:MAG: ATP/GTP-binding protein, partial [Candidatus Thiodiazotropha sp. 6PLUC10]